MPDRVRQSLFDILRGHVQGVGMLDAFAGTGSLGLEAISRGAGECVFIERDHRAADLLEQNVRSLGVEDRCQVVIGDALGPSALARCPEPAHLIVMDPPYAMVRDAAMFERIKGQLARLIQRLDPNGYAVLRTPWPIATGISGHEHPGHSEQVEGTDGVDLGVESALGPETHAYGRMALHLYMRATQG